MKYTLTAFLLVFILQYANGQANINQVTGAQQPISGQPYRVYVDSYASTGSSGSIYLPSYSLISSGGYEITFRVFASISDSYCLKITQEPSVPWNPYFSSASSNKSGYKTINTGNTANYIMNVVCPSSTSVGSPSLQVDIFKEGLITDTQVGGQVYNLITDVEKPTSSITSITQQSNITTVNWSGYDGSASAGASGIWKYDIQVKKDNGAWQDWLIGVSGTSSTYPDSVTTVPAMTQGSTFYFQSRAYDNVGNVGNYGNIRAVSVNEINNNPKLFFLSQNYPNPFNPTTTIFFSIPTKTNVTLKIYNVLGKEVATLANEEMSAGNYSRVWDASSMPSGVYFCRIQAGTFSLSKKLVLTK